MAGKADLVNSIVDSVSYLQDIPTLDGWKGGIVAGADAADAPAPGGSLTLDPLGGAGG